MRCITVPSIGQFVRERSSLLHNLGRGAENLDCPFQRMPVFLTWAKEPHSKFTSFAPRRLSVYAFCLFCFPCTVSTMSLRDGVFGFGVQIHAAWCASLSHEAVQQVIVVLWHVELPGMFEESPL